MSLRCRWDVLALAEPSECGYSSFLARLSRDFSTPEVPPSSCLRSLAFLICLALRLWRRTQHLPLRGSLAVMLALPWVEGTGMRGPWSQAEAYIFLFLKRMCIKIKQRELFKIYTQGNKIRRQNQPLSHGCCEVVEFGGHCFPISLQFSSCFFGGRGGGGWGEDPKEDRKKLQALSAPGSATSTFHAPSEAGVPQGAGKGSGFRDK